jgi:hypothetical protein
MDPKRHLFERPTLHIVIAEDEKYWADRIEQTICEPVRQWSLCRTEQFFLQIHRCPTVQEFKETVEPLLKAHNLVYATLDMKMPARRQATPSAREMAIPDPQAGRRMVEWCLEQEGNMAWVAQSLEFCLISGEQTSLDSLYRESGLQAKLRRRGVKRVYKDAIDSGVVGDLSLDHLWPDIRNFVLKHIRFCTFPERLTKDDPETHPHAIWFDPHEKPARLLVQADSISRKMGGLYLIFADAEGYDVDWFRLVCHLRNVKGIAHDFRTVVSNMTEDWGDVFENLPEALLIRHMEDATNGGYDIRAEMKVRNFLARACDGEHGLVFVRFPFFATQVELGSKLPEAADRAILNECLSAVLGQSPRFDQGIGFAYADHEHIVAFPDYEKVLKPEVIRNTIAFQAACRAQQHGLGGVSLDPEVNEVMCEMPWNELGLHSLHNSVRVAYQNAADSRDRSGQRYVGVKDFKERSAVRLQYDGELGFRVRGRWLLHVLEQNGLDHPGAGNTADDGPSALAGLEVIHDLFESLERLIQLQKRLENAPGGVRFGSDFSLEKFKALEAAHKFLKSMFDTPKRLHERMLEFRPHAATGDWMHYYPGLRRREGWLPLVQHIKFTWPFAQVPLHRAVDQYLSNSGVIYQILTEPQTVLDRYHQDLQSHWEKVEADRKDLMQRVHEREEQRRAAALYVRQHHSQPVVVHLDMPEAGPRHAVGMLTQALQSLTFFNAYLAICENKHRFGGKYCSPNLVDAASARIDLGPSVNLLCHYCEKLAEAGKLGASVFRYWSDGWPRRGQLDALRVASSLARELLSVAAEELTEEERKLFARIRDELPQADCCPISDILTFLCVKRNTFEKRDPQVLLPYTSEIWDLMRRFVFATTAPIRLGEVGSDVREARLWARRGPETVSLPADERLKAGDVWIFESARTGGKPPRPLFPVGHYIRLHPSGNSVWTWYGQKRWANLSHVQGMSGPAQLSHGPEHPWLIRQAADGSGLLEATNE